MDLYKEMASKPMPVNLNDLWSQLGIRRDGDSVTFDKSAPLASVRSAIC